MDTRPVKTALDASLESLDAAVANAAKESGAALDAAVANVAKGSEAALSAARESGAALDAAVANVAKGSEAALDAAVANAAKESNAVVDAVAANAVKESNAVVDAVVGNAVKESGAAVDAVVAGAAGSAVAAKLGAAKEVAALAGQLAAAPECVPPEPPSAWRKFVDTVVFFACLYQALSATDRTMRKNLRDLDQFTKIKHPASGWVADPSANRHGDVYVRVDDGPFWMDHAAPTVLQGALATCYCVLFFAVASVAVTVLAYTAMVLKGVALSRGSVPIVDGSLFTALSKVVMDNTVASAEMLVVVSAASAAAAIVAGGVMALVAVADRRRASKWTFRDADKKGVYVKTAMLEKVGRYVTWSGLFVAAAVVAWSTEARKSMQAFAASIPSAVYGASEALARAVGARA